MIDFVESQNISLRLTDAHHIKTIQNAMQTSIILKSDLLGYVLIIDGELHHVQEWSYLYHEPLVHLPMAFCEDAKTALILGGGDFFAAHELLKYNSIQKVVMCDHDKDLIDFMISIYPHAQETIKDPRFYLEIGDARKIIKSKGVKYDLIINDCFDFINDFNKDDNIYRDIYEGLSEMGVCSDLVYRNVFDEYTTSKALSEVSKYTSHAISLQFVPEYPGVLHLLTIWGNNKNVSQYNKKSINAEQLKWIENMNSPMEYFQPEFLEYYLAVPQFIKKLFPISAQEAF